MTGRKLVPKTFRLGMATVALSASVEAFRVSEGAVKAASLSSDREISGSGLSGKFTMGTVLDSRAARWSTVSDPATAAATDAERELAGLAARARHLAGSAALQARVAERRGAEARDRLRTTAALGAAAAVASLACAALAAVPAFAPDLVAPQICWAASAAAVLLGLVPAILLIATALGRPIGNDRAAAAVAAATAFATLGANVGRAIEALEADVYPEVARAVGALVHVLETEAGTAARSARPQATGVPPQPHQRIVPIERRVVVRTADGRKLIGTIADVSLSGVALTACLPRLATGETAMVGSRRAVVARLWERGIAFRFEHELEPATFDEAIVL